MYMDYCKHINTKLNIKIKINFFTIMLVLFYSEKVTDYLYLVVYLSFLVAYFLFS